MKITLAAIGKMKQTSPEASLWHEYGKRLPWKITLLEYPASTPAQEGQKLWDACNSCHKRILLDERGALLDSVTFARQIAGWQQEGASRLGFIIGGADGLDHALHPQADQCISFGRATWPHMLVRAMLAEQLYRAWTIIENHPYHRG